MDKNGYILCAALIVYDNQATSPAVVPWDGFTWVTLEDVAANYVNRQMGEPIGYNNEEILER